MGLGHDLTCVWSESDGHKCAGGTIPVAACHEGVVACILIKLALKDQCWYLCHRVHFSDPCHKPQATSKATPAFLFSFICPFSFFPCLFGCTHSLGSSMCQIRVQPSGLKTKELPVSPTSTSTVHLRLNCPLTRHLTPALHPGATRAGSTLCASVCLTLLCDHCVLCVFSNSRLGYMERPHFPHRILLCGVSTG